VQNDCACLHDHAHPCLRVLRAPKRVNMRISTGRYLWQAHRCSSPSNGFLVHVITDSASILLPPSSWRYEGFQTHGTFHRIWSSYRQWRCAHGSRKPTTMSSIVTTAKDLSIPQDLVTEKDMAFGCCPAGTFIWFSRHRTNWTRSFHSWWPLEH
jgi:hypothetical protein